MRILLALLLLRGLCLAQSVGDVGGGMVIPGQFNAYTTVASAGGGGGLGYTNVVQHWGEGSIGNDGSVALSNNGIMTNPAPNAVQAGNTLVCCFQALDSASPFGVGDEKGDFFTKLSFHDPVNDQTIYLYYATNTTAGTHQCYITNKTGSGQVYLTPTWFELCGVKAYQPVDTSAGNNGTGTAITSGSITPSGSGDILITPTIWDSGGTNYAYTAGSQANITWRLYDNNNVDLFGTQVGTYNSASAINPAMSVSASIGWAALTVAFKPATAQGSPTPSGMQILAKLQYELTGIASGAITRPSLTNTMGLPGDTAVNLIVGAYQTGTAANVPTNITDLCGNTYWITSSNNASGANPVTLWIYATNAISSPTNVATLKMLSTAENATVVWYLVKGARAAAYDTRAFGTGNQSGTGNVSTGGITPGGPGIVFNEMNQDENTGAGVTTGQTWDVTTWLGNTLSGPSVLYENNEWAHTNTVGTTSQVFTYKFVSGSTPLLNYAWDSISFLAP